MTIRPASVASVALAMVLVPTGVAAATLLRWCWAAAVRLR